MAEHRLGIISDPKYGVGDRGEVWLSFEVYLDESRAFSGHLAQPAADEFIRAAGVADVHQLDGRPVWCEEYESRMWRVVKAAKMGAKR